jgi:hypothetical protein
MTPRRQGKAKREVPGGAREKRKAQAKSFCYGLVTEFAGAAHRAET